MDSQAYCPTTEHQSLQLLVQSLYRVRRLWLKSHDLMPPLKELLLGLPQVLRAQKPRQQVRPPSQVLPMALQQLAQLVRLEQALQRQQWEQPALGRA
jgi:hypothetical protein